MIPPCLSPLIVPQSGAAIVPHTCLIGDVDDAITAASAHSVQAPCTALQNISSTSSMVSVS
jgi:hypothetical protein